MFSLGVLSVLALAVGQAMSYDPTCSDNVRYFLFVAVKNGLTS
jgi:hypothetical protein